MSDATDQRSSGGSGATWAVGVIGTLVLYALSPGPVGKILVTGGKRAMPHDWARKAFEAVYSPLIWLNHHCPPVHEFYRWYFSLWDA